MVWLLLGFAALGLHLEAVSTAESSNGRAFVSFFSLQGARGLPGTAGLPGMKGHRVSLLCVI